MHLEGCAFGISVRQLAENMDEKQILEVLLDVVGGGGGQGGIGKGVRRYRDATLIFYTIRLTSGPSGRV